MVDRNIPKQHLYEYFDILFMIGLIYLGLFLIFLLFIKFALALFQFTRVYLLGSKPNFKKFGSWSVITGATDGIGLAFARELAKSGQNIVLISRNSEKLEVTASKIREDFEVEVKSVVADFSDLSIYDHIKEEIKDLDIGVLVNNVGMSYEYPEYFSDIKNRINLIDKMLAINVSSVTKMTNIVLDGMVSKKKGVILNISSGAALMPTPLLTLYSASKQFVDHFSKSLNYECKKDNVIVQCVMPYFVTTKLSKIRRASFFIPTPEKYVRSTLKTIGKTNRTYGCFSHAIQGAIFNLIPESFYMKSAFHNNNHVRRRALKKLSAKQE